MIILTIHNKDTGSVHTFEGYASAFALIRRLPAEAHVMVEMTTPMSDRVYTINRMEARGTQVMTDKEVSRIDRKLFNLLTRKRK